MAEVTMSDERKDDEGVPTSKGGLFAKAAANAARGLRDQIAHQAEDLRDAGTEKIVEIVADFNAALPVLKEAGYTLRSVDMGFALPPKLVATFNVGNELPQEQLDELVRANADKKITSLTLAALGRARKLQTRISFSGLTPKGIALEIGLTPQVTVQFA
jgi:hypothetical protein